ncbi:MAG: hypothetical protein R3B41_01960 [Candidatus Doudnabacteria bacterium]
MNTLLNDIIDSVVEANLLGFFLASSSRTYSLKELTSRVPHTQESVAAAVKELSNKNILSTCQKNGISFFYLNPKNHMLEEVKEEFQKIEKPIEDELFAELKKLGDLEGIYLSGIFTGMPGLPVDLLLVGKVNLSKLDLFLQTTKRRLGIEVDYSIMSKDEFELRKGTFDRFIKDIFDYRHIVVHEGRVIKRKIAKKQPSSSKPIKSAADKSIAKKVIKKTSSKSRTTAKSSEGKSLVKSGVKKKALVKKAPKKTTTKKQVTASKKQVVKKTTGKSRPKTKQRKAKRK